MLAPVPLAPVPRAAPGMGWGANLKHPRGILDLSSNLLLAWFAMPTLDEISIIAFLKDFLVSRKEIKKYNPFPIHPAHAAHAPPRHSSALALMMVLVLPLT
jgi:hypothetical protein